MIIYINHLRNLANFDMQTMIEWVWRDPCSDLLTSWSQKGVGFTRTNSVSIRHWPHIVVLFLDGWVIQLPLIWHYEKQQTRSCLLNFIGLRNSMDIYGCLEPQKPKFSPTRHTQEIQTTKQKAETFGKKSPSELYFMRVSTQQVAQGCQRFLQFKRSSHPNYRPNST